MKTTALVFAVTAAALTSGAAFAQSASYGNDRYDRDQRYERQDYPDRHGSNQRDYGYRYDRDGRHDRYVRTDRYDRYDRYDGYRDGYRGRGHAYGHRNHWKRGARISHDYGRYVVVSDWHRHRGLYAPQRGYHWVQTGNDYALVAIATGIIASVLLSN